MIVACQPVATPVAVVTPTPTEASEIAVVTATAPPMQIEPTASALRYGIPMSMQGTLPDIDQLEATGEIVLLDDISQPDILGNQADVVITYGAIDGWQQAPNTLEIALVINSNSAPFTDPAIASIVRHSLNPGAIAQQLQIADLAIEAIETGEALQLRTDLANAGYPDGFELDLGYVPLPGLDEIINQLAAINIDVRARQSTDNELQADFSSGDVQLGLILIHSSEQRQEWIEIIGEVSVIDLYSLPISYQVVPDLELSFTEYGIPYVAE